MQTIGLITKPERLSIKLKRICLSLSHQVALIQLLPKLLLGSLLGWEGGQRSINKLFIYSVLTYSITAILYCETIISTSAFLGVISSSLDTHLNPTKSHLSNASSHFKAEFQVSVPFFNAKLQLSVCPFLCSSEPSVCPLLYFRASISQMVKCTTR